MSTAQHVDYLGETYGKARAQLGGSLPADLDGFMTRWFSAVNAQNIDAQLAMCSEDIRVEDPAMQGRFTHGKDEFRRFAEITYVAFPDMHFTEVGAPYVALDGNSLAVRWRGTGTLTGDISGWPPENPGPLIKATGKKKRALNKKGKAKLNVTVTYTPRNGDPQTQPLAVKLKKKR